MARLIDADAFGRWINDWRQAISSNRSKIETYDTLGMVMDMMDEIPTVDAVPVVHGEWVRDHGDYGKLICSRCKCKAGYRAKETELGYNIFNVSPSNYCPNCGAKMDGERRTDADTE